MESLFYYIKEDVIISALQNFYETKKSCFMTEELRGFTNMLCTTGTVNYLFNKRKTANN